MAESRMGKLHQNTSLRNGGRKAGYGIVHDDYSEESGNMDYEKHNVVRFPHDNIKPEELNGPVIRYKDGEILTDNTCVCCGAVIPEGKQVCPNCAQEIARG